MLDFLSDAGLTLPIDMQRLCLQLASEVNNAMLMSCAAFMQQRHAAEACAL